MGKCFLIVPKKGAKATKEWRLKTISGLMTMFKPIRCVDHGHIKVVLKKKDEGYISKVLFNKRWIKVKDQTEHSDIYWSNLAQKLCQRCFDRKENVGMKLSILLHLMFNHTMNYLDEAKWHEQRAKGLRKLHKTVKAKDDHGWELDELKKAGLK